MMSEPSEQWPSVDPTAAAPFEPRTLASPTADRADPRRGIDRSFETAPSLVFRDGTRFTWKALLLLATTIGFIPILLWQHEMAATLYIVALVTIHVVGLVVFLWGVRRHDVAPNRKGLLVRLAGLAAVFILLSFVAGGLTAGVESILFWVTLATIWGLHTVGLLLLHVRTRSEQLACPFL